MKKEKITDAYETRGFYVRIEAGSYRRSGSKGTKNDQATFKPIAETYCGSMATTRKVIIETHDRLAKFAEKLREENNLP